MPEVGSENLSQFMEDVLTCVKNVITHLKVSNITVNDVFTVEINTEANPTRPLIDHFDSRWSTRNVLAKTTSMKTYKHQIYVSRMQSISEFQIENASVRGENQTLRQWN